ncbi:MULTISPECIES: MBL fold metallo-hydrolase [Halobacteriovorax]|uniref:MBL fold metallo-hydrolase n=1 Tax=Halobacteriovorax vibrionivorans TaxID=2152716 RepID=A0ABY0IJ99_9BACT|nr:MULTISPECIES: MBL fold metallo-hydrolase [Halobacteriovorax]RZF21624.1 MBL fold metallo-hydrolase [Halobacteriovorax vibrionivorans]TGD49083.1 MBL fold metallo-hydrolase [Halobacteriovorax sp. Y22]
MKLLITIFLMINLYANEEYPRFSIIKTGTAKSLEGLIYEEGSLFKTMMVNHAGFLIQHQGKTILFETGLGEEVDYQFKNDMSWWAKPLFAYKKEQSIKKQLNNKYTIESIILSHAHWDHASGLRDFPNAKVIISKEEEHEVKHPVANRTFPTQFKDVKTQSFQWKEESYLNFKKHYDYFGDGTLIFVPLFGHTHGSLGLILNSKDKKYFFVGDAIWTTRQLRPIQNKAAISSILVDTDKELTRKKIDEIKKMQDRGFIIIPTHDYYLHNKLGLFPKWID